MGTIMIKLKLIGTDKYALFGPNGNQIGAIFRGSREQAKEWSRVFCTSWYNWGIDYKEIEDEETCGVPEQNL